MLFYSSDFDSKQKEDINVQTASSALRTVILRLVLLSNVFRITVVDFFREFY